MDLNAIMLGKERIAEHMRSTAEMFPGISGKAPYLVATELVRHLVINDGVTTEALQSILAALDEVTR